MVSTHCGYLTMNTHWILTAVLHMAALIQTGESCVESVTPTLVFAKMEEILTFNCTSSCNSLAWETRFRKINSPPRRGSFSSLQVRVDSWGDYNSTVQCLDNDATGHYVPTATATVIPYALPSEVKIDVQKEMEEGQDYEVTCHVINVSPFRLVTVQLHINNETIFTQGNEGDETLGLNNMTKTFTITANRQQTEFHCLAKMNLTGIANTTVSSPPMEVSVLYPPKFTSCPKSFIWEEGINKTFNCLAEGNPPPTVLCKNQDREFHSPRTFPLGRDASGVYECQASNHLNTDHQFVNITVQYPPKFTSCPQFFIWEEGINKTFNCLAEGNPPPTVRCKNQDREFHSPRTFPLGRDASGVYECQASNYLNTDHQFVTITVQYPPGNPEVISSAHSTINVGASFNLSCNADAQPPPLYSWSVPLGATVTYTPDNSTITINNASSAHSGSYTCVVSNKLSQSDGLTHVEVQIVSPVIYNGWLTYGLPIFVVVLVLAILITCYCLRKKAKKGFYDLMGWNEKSNTTLPLEEKNNDTLLPITDPAKNLLKH